MRWEKGFWFHSSMENTDASPGRLLANGKKGRTARRCGSPPGTVHRTFQKSSATIARKFIEHFKKVLWSISAFFPKVFENPSKVSPQTFQRFARNFPMFQATPATLPRQHPGKEKPQTAKFLPNLAVTLSKFGRIWRFYYICKQKSHDQPYH